MPDIKKDGTGYSGGHHIRVRHIGGDYSDATDGDVFGIYGVSTLRFKAGEKARLLALFDFAQTTDAAQGFAVLALYDVTREPVLLDAADIGYDRWTSLFTDKLLPLGNGARAVVSLSTHFNTGQSYAGYSLILLKDDKISRIDHMTLLNDMNGSIEHGLTVAYAVDPKSSAIPAPINATVTETIKLVEDLCQGFDTCSMASKKVHQTYLWDAGKSKYVPDSDAFEKVKIENENRF